MSATIENGSDIAESYAIAEYNPFRAEIAELKAGNAALVFDYTSEAGEKEARSHIHKLRLSKGALDRVRKEVKDESLKRGRLIDAEAKEITAEIDAMIAVHQTPLDEKAAREQARVDAIKARIEEIVSLKQVAGLTSESIAQRASSLNAIVIDASFAEFMALATMEKETAAEEIDAAFDAVVKQESEARELAALRAEKAAQKQRDRDAKIASEAAAKAERDAAAAIEAGRIALEAADRRQRETEEKASRDLAAAEERAKQAEAQAKLKAEADLAEAKRKADAVIAAEKAAEEKRERNKKHRATINNTIVAVLIERTNISTEDAKEIIRLIVGDELPNVRINY